MNVINNILDIFSSYAILTTHSPLIVHELPSSSVSTLRNIDGDIMQFKVGIETFGANISNIINNIFDVKAEESLFKTSIIELAKNHSKEEIHEIFSNQLDINARMFLSLLYSKEGDN